MTDRTGSAGRAVLTDGWVGGDADAMRLAKRVALVALGVGAMAIAAKVKVPMWPVPITLQTLVILSVGAAYGARLGLVTVIAYLAIGAIGFDVFTSSSSANNGVAYMLGGTGGYLVGYVLAVLAMGAFARRGWDRSVLSMAAAMLIATALIYIPGVLWLGQLYLGTVASSGAVVGWATVLDWGLWPFLIGDALKLALAAALFPALWRLVGDARA